MLLYTALTCHVASAGLRRLEGISLETVQDPGCLTVSGIDPQATPGQNCSFPFRFQDITYHGCTAITDRHNQLWCSTDTDDARLHQQGHWGYCNLTCTRIVAEVPPECCTCVDSPEVAANGGTCAALKTFFGCETDLSTLDPRSPPDTLVSTVCPSTCGQDCCLCPNDDDRIFIDPITNAPTATPARTLNVWNPSPSPPCADSSVVCKFFPLQCSHDWCGYYCPATCNRCPTPPSFSRGTAR